MNKEALEDLYTLFVNNGYKKSMPEFITLLNENEDAYSDAFTIFKNAGYRKGESDFATLIGIERPLKKKEEGMASPSEDGSLASSETEPSGGTYIERPFPTPTEEEIKNFQERTAYELNKDASTGMSAVPLSYGTQQQMKQKMLEEEERNKPLEYVDTPGAANIMPPEPSTAMSTSEKMQYDYKKAMSEYDKNFMPGYGPRGKESPEYLQDEYIDVPGADNIMRPEGVTLKEEGEVIQRKGEEKREADKKTLEKIQQKENLILSEEFQNDIASITEDVIDYNSSDAIDLLTEKYGKYGFVFRNVGLGSAIIPKSFTLNAIEVISTDNGATEVIELKPLAAGTTKKIKTRDETNKLKSFITNNAIPAGVVPEVTDDITNAVRLQTMRKNYTQLDDLSVGTLELTYREMPNGNFIVYPTLFPKNAATDYSTDPSEWMLLDADEAYLEAVLRGEVVSVDSEEKAKDLVNGSWKNISAVDVEADRFYKKRGLDYNAYMDMYNKYEDIMDKIVAIQNSPMYEFQQDYSEEGGFEEQQAMKEKMAFLYIDGKKREDANNVLKELKDEAAILRESVNQDEFQRVREDFDKYLQDTYATNASIAIDERIEADLYIEAMNELSINMLGLTAEEVASYEPKTEQEAEFVDKFNTEYDIIKIKKQEAADRYDIAHTWFNKKSDKAVMDEWVEDLDAISNSYKRGLANGNIGYIILAISLGLKDIDENSTVEEAAAAISKYAAEAQTGKEGRGFYRYQKGRTFAEEWDAFYDQPLEVGISLAAESLTQMLPYGMYIIPASVATGAGMGAAYGAAGRGGVGTVPGAITGGGRGLQGGFATTVVALEYTNAVMDAARKKGYNVLDPEQMEIALRDADVWEEGKQIGLKRGLTIGAISLLQTSLAGRVFRVKPLSSRATRLGALTAEQVLLNPLFEGGGEFLAQKVAGQKTNRKEIISEIIGGLFMPFANPISYSVGAINMYSDMRGKNNLSLAQRLSNVSEFNNVGETDSRISKWANEMHRLGKITSEQNQEIQKNVGRRREAKSLLDVSGNKNASTEVETRVMQLLAAKEKLSSTTNSRELFSEKIKNINNEIAETVSTGEVASKEAQVNLEGLVDISGRSVLDDASPYYAINGKKLSKKQFVSKMQKLTPEQTLKTNFIISNDADTQGIAEKKITEALKTEGKTTADVGVDTDVTESFAEGLGETTSLDDIMEGGVEVDMDGAKVILTEDETGVTLESIETEEGKKGQGKAEAAIKQITEKADNDGVNITLKVVPKDNTVDANRLQALYERNGFEMQEDGVTMVREAKNIIDKSLKTSTDEKGTTTTDEKRKPAAGNRLFNEPLQAAIEIAKRFTKRKGIDSSEGKEITELDNERAKKIADAYEKGKSNPNDKEVQKAYAALIKETLEQYEEILRDGYTIEINNDEPYNNSKDMIEDLRQNKNMKIFSTESGFGERGITEADRKSNPMLAPTKFKDKNGQPLLVNDVFRFVHDFFGHAKRGNGFGPIGEENAWDVHSRMYSPIARRAMTTETRGQNSWVNFSGVNDKAFALRNEARALRREGKFEEALAKVEEAYSLMAFAEQKVMLLPEEFSLLPEEVDISPIPETVARPNKADVKAFDDNTIEESRLDGILSAIADKNIAGKKLTKFQERVAEKHKTRVSELEILKQDVASLEVDLEERLGSDEVQFQLSEGKTEDNAIDEKTREAKKLFSELDKQESSGETVVVGEPTVEPTPITVGENLSLVEKIKRFKIKDLVNKKINLLMADKLKVELKDPTKPHNPDTNPYVKMGGNFFPLMERLFGKVAWASITDVAATKIIKGAMDADYSVVYNMGDGGIMSNIVMAEMLNEKIPDNQKTKIFNLIKNRVKESELKDVKKAKKHLNGATDIMSFFKALQENENVDTRAAVMELILPETLDVKTNVKLSQELITLGIARDVLIDETSEEFTKDLQTGALTMVVEITNKDGVKVSELKRQLDERLKKKEITQKEYDKGINEIIASAKISKEEAQAEGMQIHPNYPFYIRGRAVALMEETAPFYRLTDYYSNQLQERAVGLEKKRSGKVKYNANQAETEVFEKIQEAKSDKVNKANKLKAIEEILASDAFAKLKARDRKKMKPLLEKALQSNSNDAIKNLLKEAELPLAKMVNYSKAEAISAASTSAMTTSTTAYQISELNPTPWEIFLERLTKAFPTVEVITSQQEFDELTKNLWAKKLLTKNQTVYGAVYEGKLYLNGRVENFNTPIHEFGHIWINTAKQASPELYNKGMELISQDNTYINQIKNSSDYNRIIKEMRDAGATEEEIDTYIKEEALATAIGDKGESFVNASVSRDFKQWLVDLYKNIQKLFGISEYTAEQLENITLDEFVQAVTVDLLSGKELFKGQDVSALSSTLQLMTGDNVSAESIVSLGRELGYTNDAIKAILQNRGFDASTIKNALEIEVDLFNKMPYEFGNINEGAREGLKLFNDVKDKLQRFARQGKSAIEIRQKAQDILKAHPLFKNQIERIQLELQNAIDRDLKINRGPKISKEINGIRKRIADIKKGQRNIKAAQTQLKNTIRTALVGIKNVSKSSVNKINNLITQATPENVEGITNLILAEIDTMVDAQQAESLRQSTLEFKRKVRAEEKVRRDVRNFQQEIRRVIRKSFAEMTKDTPAKVREFRVATINRLNKILNETNDQNYTEQLTKVLDELDNSREQVKKKLINEIKDTVKVKVKKTRSGKLTASGVDVRGKSYLDAVSRVLKLAMNGDVDGIINLMNSIDEDEYNTALDKDERGQKLSKKELDILNLRDAIDSYADIVNMELEQVKLLLDDLKNTRAESIKNFNTRRKMRRQLSESIKEQFKTQISKDFSELYDEKGQRKSDSQLKKDRKPIMQAFIKDGFLETLKDFKARVTENLKYKTGALAMFMKESMFNLDLITQRLDRNTNGMFTEFFYNSLLDMENNALRGYFIEEKVLDGITNKFTNKEWNKWKYSLGNDVITLDGIVSVQEDTSKEPYSVELNRDQAMALYALTLNDTQREKLNNQGLDDAKILQLKEFIGEDNIAIIESTVDYLSNPYFESVNNVFMQANDISLRQIENYFPTQTDVSATNSEDLFNGDFFKVFNAEWQSALKERTAKIGDVVMNRSFTQTLEKHFRDMERFKAYALGVKTMNQVYKSPDVQTLLDMSGYKNIFQQMLSQGINPNAVPKMKRGDKLLSWGQNTFSGIVLGFKPIQTLKQTASFMLPLGDYQFRKGKHTPVVDLFTFMYDYADVLANRKKNVAEAKEMSGIFEERYRRGMKGDLLAIESGQRTYRPALEAQGKKGAVARAVSRAKAFFTSYGDINGVLGYKARFNRDIKNGMSKAEALRRFNEFDSTQQAQTNVNKIGLQQTNNPLVKAVTMFGSASFLLLNNTMKYAGRIINGTATYSDYVNFIQNAVVANMMYTTLSYSMALLFGDKDDREYALKQILYSGNPLTLLYRLPLVGAAIESGIAAYRGEYFSGDSMKNPYNIYAKKLAKVAKEGDAYEGTKLLLEFGTGAPMDPAEGIFNIATGEGEMDDMFKILGVAKSYRPGYKTKEKPAKKKSSGLNLTKKEREALGLPELPELPKMSDDLPKLPTLGDMMND